MSVKNSSNNPQVSSAVNAAKPLFGTVVSACLEGRDERELEFLMQRLFDQLMQYEKILSRFNPDSEISRINKGAALSPVKGSPETYALLKYCHYLHRISKGIFDITVAPYMDLLRRYSADGRSLDKKKLKEATSLIGMHQVVLDDSARSVYFKRKGVALDLGGIGKGYAVDKAIQWLKNTSPGVSGIINTGGQVTAFGNSCGSVEVADPHHPDGVLTGLWLQNASCATSSDAEYDYKVPDEEFSHLKHPKNLLAGWASVTVVAKTAVAADAFSTIHYLNAEAKLDEVSRSEGIDEVIWIKKRGSQADKMPHIIRQKSSIETQSQL